MSSISPLFIYEPPFVVRDTKELRYQYLSETLDISEFESSTERQIYELIFKFVVDEALVEVHPTTNKLVSSQIDNTGSWKWMVNYLNLRSIVDVERYAMLISSLRANEEHHITQLIDLHARLGMFYETKVLNTIVNRVMRAIQIVPWRHEEDHHYTSWQDIHQETPFIWLVLVMQGIIRGELGKKSA